MTTSPNGVGIWSASLRYGDAGEAVAHAAELETLGYRALWIPDVGGDLFDVIERLLAATETVTIATGILNLWMHEPSVVAAQYTRLTEQFGDRVLLGIGVSHGPLIDMVKEPGAYAKPVAKTAAYLAELEAQSPTVPRERLMVAALGPKMLALSGELTAGTHLYNVWPEHTAHARAALGPDGVIVPEQAVVLEQDPERARAIARQFLATYLPLPNYANHWFRFGFTPEDTEHGGSDALVDAIVAWGDADAIAQRVQAHFDAGANQVCVQVLTDAPMTGPIDEWRELAPHLRNLG